MFGNKSMARVISAGSDITSEDLGFATALPTMHAAYAAAGPGYEGECLIDAGNFWI
jgi:hypothetical protein